MVERRWRCRKRWVRRRCGLCGADVSGRRDMEVDERRRMIVRVGAASARMSMDEHRPRRRRVGAAGSGVHASSSAMDSSSALIGSCVALGVSQPCSVRPIIDCDRGNKPAGDEDAGGPPGELDTDKRRCDTSVRRGPRRDSVLSACMRRVVGEGSGASVADDGLIRSETVSLPLSRCRPTREL